MGLNSTSHLQPAWIEAKAPTMQSNLGWAAVQICSLILAKQAEQRSAEGTSEPKRLLRTAVRAKRPHPPPLSTCMRVSTESVTHGVLGLPGWPCSSIDGQELSGNMLHWLCGCQT